MSEIKNPFQIDIKGKTLMENLEEGRKEVLKADIDEAFSSATNEFEVLRIATKNCKNTIETYTVSSYIVKIVEQTKQAQDPINQLMNLLKKD